MAAPPKTRLSAASTDSCCPSVCAAAGRGASVTPVAAATPSVPSVPSTARRVTPLIFVIA